MTKEKILDKAHLDFVTQNGISSIHTKEFPGAYKEQAIIAMDECAKQQAIAFAEWIAGNGFRRMRGRKNKERVYGNWYVPSAGYGGGEPTTFTTDQLFQLFLEHQTK